MCDDNDQTKPSPPAFDFSAFPENSVFHERRDGPRRRKDSAHIPDKVAEPTPAPNRGPPRQERTPPPHRSHHIREAVYVR